MSSQDTLADRYGTPAPWRRPAMLSAIVVLALAFGGWLAWTTIEQATPAVASGELTFDVIDDTTATAAFVIELSDADVEATCELKAYADDHMLVGRAVFTPEPDARGRVEHDVSTERRATSVELVGCTAPGQSRPR
ncbi:MAG: DUF4307 domain-containing protein [Nocardioides sp.]